MLYQYILTFAILLSIGLSSQNTGESLKLVVEVCRHGERAPHTIYPLAENPDDNFETPMELTMTGA